MIRLEGRAELFDVLRPEQALAVIREHLPSREPRLEELPLADCLGRYLARDVTAPEDVPPFTRSTMDGFAVKARDTFGASAANPVYLEVAGTVAMGAKAEVKVRAGTAAAIATGGMLPAGADAVVMSEYCNRIGAGTIEVTRPVGPGENLAGRGDDIQSGETVLRAGEILRPQELGALASLGIEKLSVHARARVGVLSTGDEIVDIDAAAEGGRIRDINRYTLVASLHRSGAEPVSLGICPDDEEELYQRMASGLESCDALIVTGGSSVGALDLTPRVIDRFGQPGVLVHGLAIKPGKPTILAVVAGKPVFGLPGNAVSALDVYRLVVEPVVHLLGGDTGMKGVPVPTTRARIGRNLSSVAGREDRYRVELVRQEGELWAQPLLGKSGQISLMVRADGVAVIPYEAEGVARGDEVVVELL